MELQESIGAFVDIFVDTGSSIALIFRRFLPKPLIIRDFQIFHAFFRKPTVRKREKCRLYKYKEKDSPINTCKQRKEKTMKKALCCVLSIKISHNLVDTLLV